MRKPRLLITTEFSGLSTGFAAVGREFLQKFTQDDRLVTAEFAIYADMRDHNVARQVHHTPWQVLLNIPQTPQELAEYGSNPFNQFGSYGFEKACLQFLPDVCLAFGDPWGTEFLQKSPFRPFYHLLLIPTIDSEKLNPIWIDQYAGADSVFGYTEWGINTLIKESAGNVNAYGAASPGANLELFQPAQNKIQVKQSVGLPTDSYIIGNVNRNQIRKLFPDLLESFRLFLDTAPKEISRKSYLYLHTTYPDVGWNIPQLLKEFGLSHRVYFTYGCTKCGFMFANLFMDARGMCRRCGQYTAIFPTAQIGCPTNFMPAVMNTFDVYVQYSVCEGLGLSQAEAAACGVPFISVDYSAMQDIADKTGNEKVSVQRMFRDTNTHQARALPNNKELVEKLISVLSLPDTIRRSQGFVSREGIAEHFNYDVTVSKLVDHILKIELPPIWSTWGSPPRLNPPQMRIPQNMSNDDFIRWGLVNVAGYPELIGSLLHAKMLKDLNHEMTLDVGGHSHATEMSILSSMHKPRPYNRQDAMNDLIGMAEKRMRWESARGQLRDKISGR